MSVLRLWISSEGRHGWVGNEYVVLRKLKRGGYSVRAVYAGFNGYKTTVLRTRRFKNIRDAFKYLDELYNSEFLMRLFLKRAGEEWTEEKEELGGLLHVPDCS